MARRVFVHVRLDIDADGLMTPRYIFWKDSRVFKIEAITDFCPANMVIENIDGFCYTVIIQGKKRRLFFERNNSKDPLTTSIRGRWFVVVKDEQQKQIKNPS